jgi:hypothetical protein
VTSMQNRAPILLSLSSSSSLSLAAALLVILEFSSTYEAHGTLNRLYELVSRSYWVCKSYLPSYFIVFQIFILDELVLWI